VRCNMNQDDPFKEFWAEYAAQSQESRNSYFISLSGQEQARLIRSFYEHGWVDLFAQNEIDELLDKVEELYDIDLIELRIDALRHGKVFSIRKDIWDDIEERFRYYEPVYNLDIIFGGLLISTSQENKTFYHIRGNAKKYAKKKTR
jgi:hypothetical protein